MSQFPPAHPIIESTDQWRCKVCGSGKYKRVYSRDGSEGEHRYGPTICCQVCNDYSLLPGSAIQPI
jgi:hypothetical protein